VNDLNARDGATCSNENRDHSNLQETTAQHFRRKMKAIGAPNLRVPYSRSSFERGLSLNSHVEDLF